ncbi:MAG: hypothetical protein R2873_16850 [Caldilineaceae bacterium]
MDEFVSSTGRGFGCSFIFAGLIAVIVAILMPDSRKTIVSAKRRQAHFYNRFAATLPDAYGHGARGGTCPLRGVDFKTASAETTAEGLEMADATLPLIQPAENEMGWKTARLHAVDGPMIRGDERPLSALNALIQQKRLIMLGGPGSGKSTFSQPPGTLPGDGSA